jgi:branched-chain amino acid transport system ATP-binding protein
MVDGRDPAGIRPLPSSLLRVRGLRLRFGGLQVLDGVDLDVARGAIHGLCGPNGAGKTSLFNCVSGLYRAQGGSIDVDGVAITRLAPHALAALGLARTFQHPCLDPRESVLDNVLVGGHARIRGGVLAGALRLPEARRAETAARQRAALLLETLGLVAFADRPAGALPFAVQKHVELCRALMAEPQLLLLDEPAGGLAHGWAP